MPKIGARIPASLDDQTPESQAARAGYEIMVQEAIGRHAWSWATKSAKLTYKGETNSTPKYEYALPNDILTPRRVLLASTPFLDFEIRKGLLLCDLKDSTTIEMIYNWRAPESDWPADFVDAMIDKLTAYLAMGLLDRPQQGQALEQMAEMKLRKAIRRDRRTYPGCDPFVAPVLARAWNGGRVSAKNA